MGRKRATSQQVRSGVNNGTQEAVAYLLQAVSSFVTDLTECPSDWKTRKIQKIINTINKPVPPSREQHVSANGISDDSAMDSEDNEIADENDVDRSLKHQRCQLSRVPIPDENRSPAEEPSTVQPTKKRVRPLDHSVDKRRCRPNNARHSRGTVGASMKKTGFPCQRCPDFEDLGCCVRGDMCPMDHGPNCIIMNLTFLERNLMGMQPDPIPKSVTLSDPLRLSGVLASAINAPDADAYNPDQPLWANSQLVAPDADMTDPDQALWSNGLPMASPNRTSACTSTGASANNRSYHPDPGTSVRGHIGNAGNAYKSCGEKEPSTRPDDMQEQEDSSSTGNTGAGCQRASLV